MKTNFSFKSANSRCCGVAVITSALHAEDLQFNALQHQTKVLKNKNSVFVCSKLYSKDFIQVKSTFENKFLPWIINLKVLRSRGYQVCFTRRRSPVQAWTASSKSFGNKIFVLCLIKIIFKWFHSTQHLKTNYSFQTLNSRCCCVAVFTSAWCTKVLRSKLGHHPEKVLKTNELISFDQSYNDMIIFYSTQPLKTNSCFKTLTARC